MALLDIPQNPVCVLSICQISLKKSFSSHYLRVILDYCERHMRTETKKCQRELELIPYLCGRQ